MGGTSAGELTIYRESLQDFDTPDKIGWQIRDGFSSIYQLVSSVIVTYDVVCPPEDPKPLRYMVVDIQLTIYCHKFMNEFKQMERLLNTLNSSINRNLMWFNRRSALRWRYGYIYSKRVSWSRTKQTLNAVLVIENNPYRAGYLDTYNQSIITTVNTKLLIKCSNFNLVGSNETELIYDYTDSGGMAHNKTSHNSTEI